MNTALINSIYTHCKQYCVKGSKARQILEIVLINPYPRRDEVILTPMKLSDGLHNARKPREKTHMFGSFIDTIQWFI